MIRVLIYDDLEARRSSVQALLEASDGLICIGAFADANLVTEQVSVLRPDVVLMDINMPGINGIEATRRIKTSNSEVKILIQTVFDDDDSIFASLKAGAEGYLLKSAAAEKIIKGIHDVYNGGAIMTPSIALRVMQFFQPSLPIAETYHLTPREKEVLVLLADGLSYKMIAARMAISYFTVNAHIRKIYEKLQVNSSSEAVALAFKKGIV